MKEIIADAALIAACGLYCEACKKYLAGRFPGCGENEQASWCKAGTCCLGQDIVSCAECADVEIRECGKLNNRIVSFLFRSDRAACLDRISVIGKDVFAAEMAEKRMMTIRRS